MAAPHEPNPRMSPSDIETYASYVEGIDPARYFDSQAVAVREAARKRWPLIADMLVPDAGDA